MIDFKESWIEKIVNGAIKTCIVSHGEPITLQNYASIGKRVAGEVRQAIFEQTKLKLKRDKHYFCRALVDLAQRQIKMISKERNVYFSQIRYWKKKAESQCVT